jgi:hypothetical protein
MKKFLKIIRNQYEAEGNLDTVCEDCNNDPHLFLNSMKKHFQPYLGLISKEEIKENLLNLYRSNVLRGNSLLHENGFSKISIYKCPYTQIQMRLHKWPKGSNDVTIHNHMGFIFLLY